MAVFYVIAQQIGSRLGLRLLCAIAWMLGGSIAAWAQPDAIPDETDVAAAPVIALLLPLQSKDFGPTADLIQAGVQAARQKSTADIALRVYPMADESSDVKAVYRRAVEQGAQAVIGPLTLAGIRALADGEALPVPTLALNKYDHSAPKPAHLYLFNLSAEAEARQVARNAYADGGRRAVTVTIDAPLWKRMQSAFVAEWTQLGGEISNQFQVDADKSMESALRLDIAPHDSDLVFLAADARKTRLLRRYIPEDIPLYGTSQSFGGHLKSVSNTEINGLRFVETPWLLGVESAAAYPRPALALSADDARFYALGIDAWRLAERMLTLVPTEALTLDGVTGSLSCTAEDIVQRDLWTAEIQGDRAVVLTR